jgi:hypothetical protein
MLLLLTSEMMWGKMLLLLITISVPTTQNKVKPKDFFDVTLVGDDEQIQAHKVMKPAQIQSYE